MYLNQIATVRTRIIFSCLLFALGHALSADTIAEWTDFSACTEAPSVVNDCTLSLNGNSVDADGAIEIGSDGGVIITFARSMPCFSIGITYEGLQTPEGKVGLFATSKTPNGFIANQNTRIGLYMSDNRRIGGIWNGEEWTYLKGVLPLKSGRLLFTCNHLDEDVGTRLFYESTGENPVRMTCYSASDLKARGDYTLAVMIGGAGYLPSIGPAAGLKIKKIDVYDTPFTETTAKSPCTADILSSSVRADDPTIIDVTYRVNSDDDNVNVRALAFQDGIHDFRHAVKPLTFVEDASGNPTSGNIGFNVPANTELNLSWKVSADIDVDVTTLTFEVYVSGQGQLPMRRITIPATEQRTAITIACNEHSDTDVINALYWYYADPSTDLVNTSGRLSDAAGHTLVDGSLLSDKMYALEYVYGKMGYEALQAGSILDYARKATRRQLWHNSSMQNSAILKSTQPSEFYVGDRAYMAIDVSAGADAETYPVEYFDSEPVGGWGEEFKTTKILLRRIEPGVFMMQNKRKTIITKPYYIGVFNITQKQHMLIDNSNPTYYSSHYGDMRPVESRWALIRGACHWPQNRDVEPLSFMGKLRARTGLAFDLPTEAQWEYACRAGTDSDYNNGGRMSADCNRVGLNATISGNVGSYIPNAWGLYDMHGTIGQWCLDYYGEIATDPVVDPEGPTSGSNRILRGFYYMDNTSSFTRYSLEPTQFRVYRKGNPDTYLGFRIALIVED